MSRPGVLLAVSPGATRSRLAVEAEVARRGWRCADVPADADLLVILNGHHAEQNEDEDGWVANLWHAIPAPKARVSVMDAEQAIDALDHAITELRHWDPSDQGEHHAPGGDAHHADHSGQDAPGHPMHDAPDHPGTPEGHDGHVSHHGDHDMHETHAGDHDMHGGHHGHAGHGMGVVDGLPMAERADDRDGLRLDRLHVPLGPALPDWPAGLVLQLALQGDVIQRADVEPTAPASPHTPFWDEPWLRAAAGEPVSRGDAARRLCAAHLDSLGRFFAVTGWADMAARARHLRDRALAGAGAAELSALVRPLIRRAERSRTLRWLTSGLGPLPAEHARHRGVSGPALLADGHAHSRMLVWLDAVGRSAAACDDSEPHDVDRPFGPRGRIDGPVPPSQALLDVLPGLLEGAEFAGARIIVASLDPDLDELVHVPTAGTAHV